MLAYTLLGDGKQASLKFAFKEYSQMLEMVSRVTAVPAKTRESSLGLFFSLCMPCWISCDVVGSTFVEKLK